MFIFRWLGIVTQKEIKMLRDDFNAAMAALNAKVDVLATDVVAMMDAESAGNANALMQSDVDAVNAVMAKVSALDAHVLPPVAPVDPSV